MELQYLLHQATKEQMRHTHAVIMLKLPNIPLPQKNTKCMDNLCLNEWNPK